MSITNLTKLTSNISSLTHTWLGGSKGGSVLLISWRRVRRTERRIEK